MPHAPTRSEANYCDEDTMTEQTKALCGVAAQTAFPSSIAIAAPWVRAWLALMVVITIAAREATHELALAVAFLGERVNGWKAAATVCGLAGVYLIVRPTSSGIGAGQAIALAAA